MVMERWGRSFNKKRVLPTFETNTPPTTPTHLKGKSSAKKTCNRIRLREKASVLKAVKPDFGTYAVRSAGKTQGVPSHTFVSSTEGNGDFTHCYLGPESVFNDSTIGGIVGDFYPEVREIYNEDLPQRNDDDDVHPLDFIYEGK